MSSSRMTNLLAYGLFTVPAMIGAGLIFVSFRLIETWDMWRILCLGIGIVAILVSATLLTISIRNALKPRPTTNKQYVLSADAESDYEYSDDTTDSSEAIQNAGLDILNESDEEPASGESYSDPERITAASSLIEERAIEAVLRAADPNGESVESLAYSEGIQPVPPHLYPVKSFKYTKLIILIAELLITVGIILLAISISLPAAVLTPLLMTLAAIIFATYAKRGRGSKTTNTYVDKRDGDGNGYRLLVIDSWNLVKDTSMFATWRQHRDIYLIDGVFIDERLLKKINFNPRRSNRQRKKFIGKKPKTKDNEVNEDEQKDCYIYWLQKDHGFKYLMKAAGIVALFASIPLAGLLLNLLFDVDPLATASEAGITPIGWAYAATIWLASGFLAVYLVIYPWLTHYVICTNIRLNYEYEPPFDFLDTQRETASVFALQTSRPGDIKAAKWLGLKVGKVFAEMRGENKNDDWIQHGFTAKHHNELAAVLDEFVINNATNQFRER